MGDKDGEKQTAPTTNLPTTTFPRWCGSGGSQLLDLWRCLASPANDMGGGDE